MPKVAVKRRDPLFEFLAVGAIIIGSVFAFGADTSQATDIPESKPSASATPDVSPSATPSATPEKPFYVVPTGVNKTIVSGLEAPWELLFLPDGQALVDERDSGDIYQITTDRKLIKVAFTRSTPPCVKFCEGGTLGMTYAADRADGKLSLFVFLTTDADNRILKYNLDSSVDGTWSLSNKRVILDGIDRSGKSTTHNGGRLAIGPDGKLWVSLGDAGMRGSTSQNWDRLGGSVLRVNLDGSVPKDNPKKGSYVWAKGLRDTQGMAWDNFGNMWTTEFGENTWDELNLMQAGKNYGWPIVEGLYRFVDSESASPGVISDPKTKPGISASSNQEVVTNPKFTPPYFTWHPEDAACSGITYVKGSLISACLRGGKLWVMPVIGDQKLGDPKAFFTGQFGRIREATVAPDGSLWLITSNRDGRGGWSSGGGNAKDDRVIRIELKKVYY